MTDTDDINNIDILGVNMGTREWLSMRTNSKQMINKMVGRCE